MAKILKAYSSRRYLGLEEKEIRLYQASMRMFFERAFRAQVQRVSLYTKSKDYSGWAFYFDIHVVDLLHHKARERCKKDLLDFLFYWYCASGFYTSFCDGELVDSENQYRVADNIIDYDESFSLDKARASISDSCCNNVVIELNFYSYQDYLNSPKWIEKRNKALVLGGFKCGKCGSEKSLQVHHLTYERIGHEAQGDLIVLCKKCHEGLHRII